MDRNTLIAFFLIALVLLFTPKYMEIFGPPLETKNNYDSLKTITPEIKPLNKTSLDQTAPTYKQKIEKVSKRPELFSTIETPLYTATFSNAAGGTIKNFRFKNYLTSDSQLVNIINNNSIQNLTIELKNLDGETIDLNQNWTKTKEPGRIINRNNNTLEYKFEIFDGLFIKKIFSFNPNNYTININLDFNDIKDMIYRDVGFSWNGGLSTTEKDTADDKTYFKAYIYQGEELEELKTKPGNKEKKNFNGITNWGAIRTKYFVSCLMPEDPNNVRSAHLSGSNNNREQYDMSFTFDCFKNSNFMLYIGPLEYEKIKNLNVGLEAIMDFGWSFIRPVSKAVLYSLKRMHEYIPNYGVVLIVFSFLVKILVFPLTKKSYQSTSAMQQIQPQVNALRDKYKNDPQKMNQATMKLYKEKGVNPLGGCLPMILQMPLLFALFIVFRTTIELRSEPFVWWIKDLSAPDKIFDLPFTIPLYGSHIAFLPILMVISTFIQQRMMSGNNQQPQQKMMQYFMTGFFFLIFNNFPSGLNLYYTLFNVLTIAQQKLMPAKPKT
ncbi:MAG: hypothetical protein CMG55_01430 [Candidatus Marinimicrobia bacterium]|nr:hypothetical protein [Candidatus Neomarinimicrobiota bacterium]|tara:strand:- start:7880 stop:9529 length:1650 start_codon:yes stop_codon:yes gene_type:complete